ncbi:hypothetical protein F8M41_011784 [Gigaspora margarita]|uniref:Uncharacterized protein n=1 Tax=Gigaspora margarita TaxID=4874 RepID=A0A8H3WZM2_GIGMA|nr:hypothetical protein F8M41_011784 [Gigaspora margarita]
MKLRSIFGHGASQTLSAKKNIRSKLLATYQNFTEISKDKSEDETVASTSKSDNANKPESSLSNNFYPSKHVVEENLENENLVALGGGCESNSVDGSHLLKQIRTDVSEESVRSFYAKYDGDFADFSCDAEVEGSVKNSSYQRKVYVKKIRKVRNGLYIVI